jgi:hypothetical protein
VFVAGPDALDGFAAQEVDGAEGSTLLSIAVAKLSIAVLPTRVHLGAARDLHFDSSGWSEPIAVCGRQVLRYRAAQL